MRSLAAAKEPPEHNSVDPKSDCPPPDGEYGSTISGIAAGGISGTIIGFFIAGSLLASMAAATGVVVGMVIGWHGSRLAERR